LFEYRTEADVKAPKLAAAEYGAKAAGLATALTDGLNKELKDCAWQPDPTTDLWDLPTVDSKTVCKLSPIVEQITGHKLKPSWVRKGGYESIAEAVADVMAKVAEHCVLPAAASIAAE
jgi:hypothetical protein